MAANPFVRLPVRLLELLRDDGTVAAQINSDHEIEIFATKQELQEMIDMPKNNDYLFSALSILFKCILTLNEKQ